MYQHVTLEERELLFLWYKQGLSLREIGRRLNRSDTTIGRELKRNQLLTRGLEKLTGKYIPCRAHEKAQKRAVKQRTQASWKGPEVLLYVREKLREGWSPETIAGRISMDHPGLSIRHETIYRMIYEPQNKKVRLWRFLECRRKKRMKKEGRRVQRDSRISEAVSIVQRPAVVANRTRLGDWETDNLIGKQTDKTALSVSVERLTRLSILSLTDKTAIGKLTVLFTRFSTMPKALRETMTADNGSENTRHKEITQALEMAMYFCHAYASWEKGSVENMNKRIRRYLPKGMSLDSLTEETIQIIEWQLNNTPRKCLDWKTPLEVLTELLDTTQTSNRCTSS